MANAAVNIKQVEKVVQTTVIEEVETINLELSVAEAEAIVAILGNCTGGGITSSTFRALRDAGVKNFQYNVDYSGYAIQVSKA